MFSSVAADQSEEYPFQQFPIKSQISTDEKPLAKFRPAVFTNLVEGFDRLISAPEKGGYATYTGESIDSGWTRAALNKPQFMEWLTGEVPAAMKGQRVTFAIPCGLGGEGGKIVGVPFVVSVNGKPLVTIHSSVESTTLWESAETGALFVETLRDGFGDPFGILLLSVPPGAVEAAKPVTIRVEGKPAPNKEGSFFMLSQFQGAARYVEKHGGVTKLASEKAKTQDLAGEKPKPADKPPGPAVNLPGRRDDSKCLTSNALGADVPRNVKLDGKYTYYDGRTDSMYFPHYSPFVPEGRETNFDETRNGEKLVGGWLAFSEGKLTDGSRNSKVGYPMYLQTPSGIDIEFDLGAECFVDEVVTWATDNFARNIEVLLKSPGEERWTLVQTIKDRAWFQNQSFLKLRNPEQHLTAGGMSARWVRVNACWEAVQCGFSEVQIWGRPMKAGEKRVVKQAYRQAGGEMKVAKPAELPLPLPPKAICPLPQEMKMGNGKFALSADVTIAVMPGASERTKRMAEVLAQDLKDEAGLSLKVVALTPDEKAPRPSIVFSPVHDTPHPASPTRGEEKIPATRADISSPLGGEDKGEGSRSLPQGYSLTITPDRVEIRGDDEQGTFYATQTLMQLIEADAKGVHNLPACAIRDWPDKPIRSVCVAVPVTEGFLKALGRYRITHWVLGSGDLHAKALELNNVARDRFVQYTPLIGYCESGWAQNPEAFTEKHPGEKYKDLNPGRINACPSHPDMWKNYFAALDRAVPFYGDYININMDEMYVPDAGSRWNVCEKCRARNLTGHELMADTIGKIITYLKSKGKKTMIIDSSFFSGGISNPDDKANDWRKSADILAQKGLAKDVIVYIWHGQALAERLRGLGFTVIAWSAGAASKKLSDPYEGFYAGLADSAFRPNYLLTISQTLWSPDRAEGGSDTGIALVEQLMPAFNKLWTGVSLPSRRADAKFLPIDLRQSANRTFTDDAPFDGKGWADLGPNYDLRALKPGKREFGGVPFEILDDKAGKKPSCVMAQNRFFYNRTLPTHVEIPVGKPCASISFLHTMDDRLGQTYWFHRELAGYYFMVYDDGTYEPLELKYAINISNFDGLNQWWDYAPRGKSIARATLVWSGQMGCGNEASLYKCEWVNPYPQKKIEKIILASTWKQASANPILIAATAVAPTDDDVKNAPKPRYSFGPRKADVIYPAKPVGRKLDLTKGRVVEDHIWKTDDGIVIELGGKVGNGKSLDITQPAWANVANLIWDNDKAIAAGASYRDATAFVKFPAARKLTGIRLHGPHRGEFGSIVDLWPETVNFDVSVSADGQTFEPVRQVDVHIGDEEGPVWIALPNKPIQAIKIRQTRCSDCEKPSITNSMGIELLELYEP